MVSLISVVFFFHVHLIWWAGCSDKTIQLFKKRSQKTRKWNEWNNKSPIQWFKIHVICVDMSTFHFHLDNFFLKKFLQVFHWLLNFGNSPLNTVWKLKKMQLVKNDFQKAQIVTHYCYWTLYPSNRK